MYNNSEDELPYLPGNISEFIYIQKVYKIRDYVILCVCPILVICGTIGNILSLLILQGRRFRGSTTSFLLSSLAVVDTLALMNGPLRYWFQHLLQWDIRSLGAASCKIQIFVTFVCTHLSAWTIVLVTTERAFLVVHPVRGPQICCRRNAYIAWVTLACVIAAMDSHFFWSYTSTQGTSTKDCHFLSKSWMDVWGWIDVAVVCVLPFVIILTLNFLVIFQLTKGQKRLGRTLAQQPAAAAASRSSSRRRDIRSITRMLVVVSFVFLLTTLPSSVLFAGFSFWFPSAKTGARYAESLLASTVVNVLFYTNNAANFFLYILGGRTFRQAFKEMISDKCKTGRCGYTEPKPPREDSCSSSDASSAV